MKQPSFRTGRLARGAAFKSIAFACATFLMPYDAVARTQAAQQPSAAADPAAAKVPNDQLDSLVAPIALYPDPLLSQTLVASTYPLEIIQLQQWLAKNPGLKDKALTDAALKQPWDPSIQAMAVLPDVVKRLADDIQWTTDLGNAFLAQQSDVMDAVQRMRKKAQGTGALASNEQQKVETKVVETKTVIVIEQANPQVVYVPAYSPTIVYGPPIYPYPPIYYPPYPVGAVAISFGVGLAVGAAWGGGGWGWGCGWGGNDIDINVNNNYVRHNNINNVNNINRGNSGKWQHNAQHRGGAPYANQATADRFGGTARGDSLSSRQSGARTQTQSGAARQPQASAASRSPSTSSAGAGRTDTGGGDRVGNREVPKSSPSSSRSSSAMGGSSGGASRASASSSRGGSSMGASRGGGRR
jgi:Protein of unknown function (DUF3300)